MSSFDFIHSAQRTIKMECDAVAQLHNRINETFEQACNILLKCRGRVVVSGMGKSGHIAKKIAATLASTGTPALFVHPGEASHGDLGMVTRDDVFIAISNSGSSPELMTLLPMIKRMGIPLIAMTGKPTSPLGEAADIYLDIQVETEACPLDLAPTSSTTVSLVMGDALAVALLEARGFTAEDFAFSHPGGALGRKLLLRVSDIMHRGDAVPCVANGTSLLEALSEMSKKSFGMTTIIDAAGTLVGVFTDGDLRRCLDNNIDVKTSTIDEVMSLNPLTVAPTALAAEAFNIMEKYKITALVVADNQKPIGILHMHDMLQAGLV
ncbi:KpsF/GutQ family sugar-phosphate isomerase [Teredinibacter purpureus]|uniref:KpsF/GutQ family sugar-phosphate isomerase n=1 Tax=Teredinibacter purpureus TaxID=2731756 RepID=UPI0005F7FB2B|nr:KpsF/GutQ family sugar-phosphate isomerase [Teredinibacter purpureus]